jgi:CheY-like chemotaxis protein
LGTKISLYLPLRAGELRVCEPVPEPVSERMRILLVEDQAAVRILFVRQLRRLGYDVTTAGGADEALRKLESGAPFDLMLSDVMLPGATNGAMLCRLVRQRWPGTAVLLATALPATALKALCEEGAEVSVPILQKPVEIDVLAAALRQARTQCDDSGESVNT